LNKLFRLRSKDVLSHLNSFLSLLFLLISLQFLQKHLERNALEKDGALTQRELARSVKRFIKDENIDFFVVI
jgi:hypothetical protein